MQMQDELLKDQITSVLKKISNLTFWLLALCQGEGQRAFAWNGCSVIFLQQYFDAFDAMSMGKLGTKIYFFLFNFPTDEVPVFL